MDFVRGLSSTALVVSGVVAVITFFVGKFVRHRRSYRGLPMPPHDFIWGHLKIMGEISNLLPKNVHLQYLTTTISKKYNMPPVFYLDLWPLGPNCMVVTDPDLAFQITANHEYQKHEEEKKAMDPLLGAGNIATAEGARWKHLHKQLSPAFSVSHVTSMRGMIAEEIMKFRGILHKLAESGEVFKLEDYGQRLIFDIIGKATFGESLKAQDNGSEALKYWEEITRTDMVVRQSWNPVKRYTLKKQIAAATTKLDALITSLVQRRFSMLKQDKPNGSSKRKQSIMELVLSEEILTGTHTLSTSFLSDAVSNVKTLLVAGTGTTADTLCFAFMLLSTRPDVVQRLRNEHDTVFTPGTNKTYTMLCDEPTKLNGLVYTTAVIKEVLRLYPIGSTVRRESPAGSVSHGGKTYSTKGQMIIPQALAMHLNPEFFANPTAFDPDRFVRDDFPRRAWRPFERGPRACLGQTLAMDELKILLLLVVRDFDFLCSGLQPSKTSAVEWMDLDLTFGDRAFQEFVFEAKPRDGMPMTVKKSKWGGEC